MLRKPIKEILDYFPRERTPRPAQVEALTLVEACYDSYDVFVLNLPVAIGKSLIALTLARWLLGRHHLKSNILTPTNILVDQYIKDNPALSSLRKRELYQCRTLLDGTILNCVQNKQYFDTCGPDCMYHRDRRRAFGSPYGVYNYHTYLGYKLYKPALIADEAHNILHQIRELNTFRVWKNKWRYPDSISSYEHLLDYIETRHDATAEELRKLLTSGKPSHIVEKVLEPYYGRMEECLKISPIDTSSCDGVLWAKSRKIFLLSATIGPQDIQQMGLSKKRVKYIYTDSPIPAERRPVIYAPQGSLSYASTAATLPKVAIFLKQLLDQKKEQKGLIHVTYAIAQKLEPLLLSHKDRLIFHTISNKKEKYEEYQQSSNKVLVACGLYEGIDLPDDAGRFQVIVKIPWASLTEPSIRYKLQQDEDWYMWEAIKLVLQACGRICRHVEDYGETYILDSSFTRMLDSRFSHMLPQWWKEGLYEL